MHAFRHCDSGAAGVLLLAFILVASHTDLFSQDTLETALLEGEGRIPFSSPSIAQDNYNLNLVGRWAKGPSRAVAVSGDTLYYGNGPSLEIMDISAPLNPMRLGRVVLPSTVEDITVFAPYAYIACSYGGLRIVDISNPGAPIEVGHFSIAPSGDTGGFVANGVAVRGCYAYVADMYMGLTIINISNPGSPARIGYFNTDHRAYGVALIDSFACVADSYDGLRVINVSDPTAPVPAGYYDMEGYAMDVSIRDSLAYVATRQTGLTILDLSVPSSPALVGNWDTDEYCSGVFVSGCYAYLADRNDGLRIIDITDPSSPFETGYYDTRGVANAVCVSGSYAYVADDWDCLCVIDVSDPSSPVEVGCHDTGDAAGSVALCGSYACVACLRDGLRIVDISTPSDPREVGYLETDDYALGVAVDGGYAYVAANGSGLRIVDVSNPSSPVEVASYDPGGYDTDVVLSGTYAYVAGGSAGLRVLDISTPSSPVEVGHCETAGDAVGVDVSGSYAYVVCGIDGLRIIDVSVPESPVEVGFHDADCTPPYYADDHACDVAVSGTHVFVANRNPHSFPPGRVGILIIDVSTPSAPVELAYCLTYEAAGVDVNGSFLYVADGSSGLEVYDVSVPSVRFRVGYYDTGGNASGVFVDGNIAAVADGDGGLCIFDCRCVPTLLRMMTATLEECGVRVTWEVSSESGIDGYYLYRRTVDEAGRLDLISDLLPADGSRRHAFLDAGAARGERYVYRLTALKDDGTEIMLAEQDVACGVPRAVSLEQNVPNPFNPETTIRFTVPERMEVDLSVYDVSGRLVTRLLHGPVAAGTISVRWDGRDARGHDVSSGVYLYRLRAGKSESSRRMVLLR